VVASKGFERRFADAQGRCAVLVEDDGRVAYAYLLDPDGVVCGDVWLYNRCEAPLEPEWRNRGLAPFANPVGYAVAAPLFPLPQTGSEIQVEWSGDHADVMVDGTLVARLAQGLRPGFSIQALKDGPLAKVLK
jgi:hypothetical protein